MLTIAVSGCGTDESSITQAKDSDTQSISTTDSLDETSVYGESTFQPIPKITESDIDQMKDDDGYIGINWDILRDVTFESKFDTTYMASFYYPTFGNNPLLLDGQKVFIEGHVIPFVIDADEMLYVVSAFPNSACFFCGGSGPESIMELILVEKEPGYKMDEWIRFKGVLKLNQDDPASVNYILTQAEKY